MIASILFAASLGVVEVIGDAGRVEVSFRTPDVVHFRAAPAGVSFADPAAAVVRQLVSCPDSACAPVEGRVVRTDGKVSVSSSALTVSVDTRTLAFSIATEDGRRVFASAPNPFCAEGASRRMSFERDLNGCERFFGLGNAPGKTFDKLDHRDSVYNLWLSDDNVHAVIPLWYSSVGYGVYACSSSGGKVDFTRNYSLSLDCGDMDFYFLWGPRFKTILSNWSALAGRMHQPPLYALGLTYRGYGQWSDADLIKSVSAQQAAGLKIDVVGVEPGWQTWAYPCSFVWHERFPDPRGFMDRMHALGVKVNLWEHPYVSPRAPFAKAIAPYGLPGADMGTRKWENGSDVQYGFGGFVPDMTMEKARDIYWNHHRDAVVALGADGFKVDETDSFSANRSVDQAFPSGIPCNAYHNILGTLTVNLLHERYRRDFNRRTFAFSRGNGAGMQRWATSAYTDFYGFRQFVMAMIAQSYTGTYFTPEIRTPDSKDDGDYMRRAQMMFLSPFPQSNEWMKPVGVLDRSETVRRCYAKYNCVHYRLVPYLYSLFREQVKTGVGVVRALPMEFQDDPRTFDVTDELMLGPSILVHPIETPGDCVARTYLPAGCDWIAYPSMKTICGGTEVERRYTADEMPIFVRKGSIVPVSDYGRNTSEPVGPVVFCVFPGAAKSSFSLYEDDGATFDYEKGACSEITLTAEPADDDVKVTFGPRRGAYVSGRDYQARILRADGTWKTIGLSITEENTK